MRIRNLLLSSVMCGGVALMSSASWSQTAPKVTYRPQGDWAVTRMAASGAGKSPYCTMARRFGENVILTFAQNGNNETSIAMDFQPKTLARGQSYYVTLDPGAQEKRAFDVTPVSDKAMVIRLGADSKFHDALTQSGVLNVDVAGLQFEFSLPDMAKGNQDMDGCVTSIVEPAAGESSKPSSKAVKLAQVDATAPAQAPAPTTVTRRASDDILAAPATTMPMNDTPPTVTVTAPVGHEVESLREENLRLKNALERERREYENRFMREGVDSSKVSEVMEKLKLLEKENGDLKYQLADARSMAPKAGAVSKVDIAAPSCASPDPKADAEISSLREENARLKADIAAQKTAMIQLEMQAGQAKADGAKTAEGGVVSRLQSRIQELTAQNSKMQSDLMSAQASAKTAANVAADGSISISQLRSVEAQMKSVEAERDNLRSQIEKMGDGKEDKLLKLSGSDWNLEQATRRYNEAEREIRRLGSQLEQARTQCTAEKKEIEYMLFDPAIATQQQISKLMTLETEVQASKDALAKKDAELAKRDGEMNDRIVAYEQQVAKLEAAGSKSKATEAELAALRNELSVAKQSAAEQIAVAQRRAQDAASEMANAQRQAQEAAAAQLATAQKQSSDKIAALQSQIQTEKTAATNDLMAQIAKMNAEKDQMAQRIALLEDEKTKMQGSEGERLALKERVSALENEKARLEARVAASVQPAAGTPHAAVQEINVASVSAVSPQSVQAEPIGAPVSLRPGQVSSRIESPAPIALAPKSAIPSDTFQPTQAVVAPVVQAMAPQAALVAVPAASNLITADALSGQLRQAGLALSGNVKKVDKASSSSMVAYSWDASGLFGSAEQKQMANAEQFQTLVNQYLDKTKARCAGDFAASPVPTMPVSGVQLASYEIACVSADGNGATAALAFYGKAGLFTAVAHEASMESMDLAMDARDRVLASVVK